MRAPDSEEGADMLTSFARFVVIPDPDAQVSRTYRGLITCTGCDWSVETDLRIDEVQTLLCGGCGNVEKGYMGIPDGFVGVPCPQCYRSVTKLDRTSTAMGCAEMVRLYCPECAWEL